MSQKYTSYLLRLWKTDTKDDTAWRVMLEDPHNHEVHGFDSLDAFFRFLIVLEADDLTNQKDLDQHKEIR